MGEIDNIIKEISPHYKTKDSDLDLKLIYDSSTETLEPVYFWLLDFANKSGFPVTKLVDNFASSVGGGHFSEIQGKASHMQQEASRVMATINAILKSVINLIYDLKEFKMRLSHYEAADSKNKDTAEAGMLALKQIWMDKVDIQRGQGSLNAMASGNLQFVTLRDAFMIVKDVKDVDGLDLNDRVKRILKPRVQEFFEWIGRSRSELEKRFEIEKTYLKSQVDSLRLQARWAKPYLKAAEQLAGDEGLSSRAELVTVFNTLMMQITLMGKGNPFDIQGSVDNKHLPPEFAKIKNKIRKYHPVYFVNFLFRGIPSKTGQHYTFGGRVEVEFSAYCLNDEELFMLNKKMEDSDLHDALKLVQGMTDDSLSQLQVDIDELVGKKEPEKEKKQFDNPFSAIFTKPKKKKESDEEKEKRLKKGIKKDSYSEAYIRNMAEAAGKNGCFDLYDKYKKGHGMASIPYTFDFEGRPPTSQIENLFGFS
ncbi:hypothetical protein HOE04_04450 [archaeon]|jgi:hypothetical protein|nr:hypothetical protein [archaeon]